MKNELIIRPVAEEDLKEAYSWYEERRKGLGDDFLLCIEEVLEKIHYNPNLFQKIHKNIRRALIQRFPYGVFYFVEGDKIIVIAVFHCYDNPEKWKGRS